MSEAHADADEVADLRHDLRAAIDAAQAAEASQAAAEARLQHVEYALALAEARENELRDLLESIVDATELEARETVDIVRSRAFRTYWAFVRLSRRLRRVA